MIEREREREREKEKERARAREKRGEIEGARREKSRRQGDLNPCGQSPADFESASLTTRT